MPIFSFPDMTFEQTSTTVRCKLFHRYYFDIHLEKLERIGKFSVHPEGLEFDLPEKKVINKLSLVLDDGLNRHLVHQLYRKPTFYLREELGMPLIGSTEIGVVDRGSNIIEIKPLTGCNFTCTYCSVEEGKNNKSFDYLVECDFLVNVAREVAKRKEHGVEFNIGPHGEPTMYPQLLELVKGLKSIPNCSIISMNTNGSLLSKKLIDELADAGMTRLNMSIPALDPELAAKLAGVRKFPMEHFLSMVEYANGKIDVLLAPVLIPGQNEGEMEKLVELSKKIKSKFPTIGIQNYLQYKKGRKAAKKQMPWEEFFSMISELEKKSGKSLKSTMDDFKIHEEVELDKPFRKGQMIDVEVVMPGRYPHEMYGMAEGRLVNILIPNDLTHIGKKVRVKIVRDKHSIFKGIPQGGKWQIVTSMAQRFGEVERMGDAV